MAKIALTSTDVPDGIEIHWEGLPCPVHDEPFGAFTPAEAYAFRVRQSLDATNKALMKAAEKDDANKKTSH